MSAVTVQDQQGRSLDAVYYGTSVVLATSGTSQLVAIPTGVTAITIAVLADTWIRMAPGTPAADGTAGCGLLPAGSVWTEGVVPGSSLALATVDGSTSTAVVRFVES